MWDRIAALTPRLRDDVRISRHRYRGRRWFVLQDALRGQWQRLDQRAYCVVALLDGTQAGKTTQDLLGVGGDSGFIASASKAHRDAIDRGIAGAN